MLATAVRHIETMESLGRWHSQTWKPWEGAPAPFTNPLQDLLRDLALLRRITYNCGLAVAGGADAQELLPVDAALSRLDPSVRMSGSARTIVHDQSLGALRRIEFPRRPTDEQVAHVEAAVRAAVAAGAAEALSASTGAQREVKELPRASSSYARNDTVQSVPLSSLRGRPVFLVGADSRYHAYESGPLVQELRARGVDAVPFLISAGYVDRRILTDWSRYVDTVYEGTLDDVSQLELTGAFVLNDWSPNSAAIRDRARDFGGELFAKVEGVQDFEDADTGRQRHAYRNADVVLAQGANDQRALAARSDVVTVGSSRLERLWTSGLVPDLPATGLVNINFTYNVLTDQQSMWTQSVVRAFDEVGVPFRISAHWAQKDVPKDVRVSSRVASEPFRDLITRSGVLVSRFSTVIFEAMARGVPVIYHNPHGEQVPTFRQPEGSFWVTDSAASLARAIPEALAARGTYRDMCEPFFTAQVDIDPAVPSEVRTADLICARLAATPAVR
jgi:hypothetical protein